MQLRKPGNYNNKSLARRGLPCDTLCMTPHEAELTAALAASRQENVELRQEVELLKQKIDAIVRRIFGASSEKLGATGMGRGIITQATELTPLVKVADLIEKHAEGILNYLMIPSRTPPPKASTPSFKASNTPPVACPDSTPSASGSSSSSASWSSNPRNYPPRSFPLRLYNVIHNPGRIRVFTLAHIFCGVPSFIQSKRSSINSYPDKNGINHPAVGTYQICR
jgi:hypothetical protein